MNPTFDGFVDAYYAFDSNRPPDHEREFTTQPARHNEFNLNLASVGVSVKEEKIRGRLALQFGNSVTKNTYFEPVSGKTSGPNETKNFQEAYVGTRIAADTWIDLGIYLGHIGAESWISKDNWTYSRALMLDYVPYYSAGVRLTHKIDEKSGLQLHLINGWQNVSENNSGKAVGFQYQRQLTQDLLYIYNNFFGDEIVVGSRPRFRAYHDFILKWMASDRWQYLLSADFGHQAQQEKRGVDAWGATAVTVRRVLRDGQSVSFRSEYYNDRHQANVETATANGFQVLGASTNFDQKFEGNAMWRTELRALYSKDKIYPKRASGKNNWDGVLVTSLSMWF
ncbi:MAG TPA: outer membrane beta-barrel protein [Bacteriovoracaceae bacterium]|nr:outer membrane beta-barrel protein [Bacteriovoracaceae bacterium]